jgi:hypothetical protein
MKARRGETFSQRPYVVHCTAVEQQVNAVFLLLSNRRVHGRLKQIKSWRPSYYELVQNKWRVTERSVRSAFQNLWEHRG